TEAKQAADEAVKGLPDSVTEKDGLQGRVDNVNPVKVPEVNDTNGNGIPDDAESLIEELEDLVTKAEEAYATAEEAYDNAVDNSNPDTGVYRNQDVTSFNKALASAQAEKAAAEARVEEMRAKLPTAIAEDFDKRLEALVDPALPEVETGDDDAENPYPDSIITGRTFGNSNAKVAETAAGKIRDKNPLMSDKSTITADKITTGDTNDTVIVGRNNHYDTATDLSVLPRLYHMRKTTIETGAGDDVVVVAGDVDNKVGASVTNRDQAAKNPGSLISTGEGNDIVKISNSIRNGSIVDTGAGDDAVVVGLDIKGGSKVLLGEGNNNLRVNGQIRFGVDITAGAGNDKVTINKGIDVLQGKTNSNKVIIDLGDGNNELTIGAKYATRTVNALEVITGDGQDVITINSNKVNAILLQTGAGDDVIDLQATTLVGSYSGEKLIESGAGNDVIKLGKFGNLANSNKLNVNAGEGDDTVEFYYSFDATANNNQGIIIGGEGTDTLSLKGEGITVSLESRGTGSALEGIQGFERIDMTSSSAQTVKLTLADVLNNNENKALYISGNSADTVDLGSDGESSWGGFMKVDSDKATQTALDGKEHTYTAYSNGDVKVYIDDQITNII
ncbi:GA-like domain-containing protein, partial [Rodentibacter pneumotropicus]